MFETVIAAMLKHKQIVFATIAVAALSGMVIAPATQVARAQLGEDIARDVLDSVFGDGDDEEDEVEAESAATEDQSGDDNQDIDQTQTQSNEQANELRTGANTATVAQSNDADQDVAAAAEASDADAESEAEDDDHDSKHKKHHHSDGSDSDTTTSSAEAIVSATAEATGIVDQDNDATVRQDSSIHDVDLSNNVAFGDDTNTQIAVPIIDQDQRAANLAEQRAANLDIEEVDVFPYGVTTGGGGDGGDGGDGGADLICVQPEGGGSPILIPISEREPGQQVLPLQACGETP